MRAAIIAVAFMFVALSACETLDRLHSAPKELVLACVLEMRVSGERPWPNLGPRCAQLSDYIHNHGWPGDDSGHY